MRQAAYSCELASICEAALIQETTSICKSINPQTINVRKVLKQQDGTRSFNKTEVESVQLGNTYIADMDKCPQDKCCLDRCCCDRCNMLYMSPNQASNS